MFFHEIGHIIIAKWDELVLLTKYIILKMLSGIKLEYFSRLENWSDFAYNIGQELLQRFHLDIMEELTVDIFGIGKLPVYLKNWAETLI